MQKIYELIDQAILFAEKYNTYDDKIIGDSSYWVQEELTTVFEYKGNKYSIYQIWSLNEHTGNYVYTIYENGNETTYDEFYLMNFLIEIRKCIQKAEKESNI